MADLVPALTAGGGSALAALLVSPYLAGFTISVPDRGTGQWWRARPRGGGLDRRVAGVPRAGVGWSSAGGRRRRTPSAA